MASLVNSKKYISDSQERLTLFIYDDGNVKWSNFNNKISEWPKEFKLVYSKELLKNIKNSNMSNIEKLKKYFYATGIKNDHRLYQELFRGLRLNIGNSETEQIKKIIKCASDYFQVDFDYMLEELIPSENGQIAI